MRKRIGEIDYPAESATATVKSTISAWSPSLTRRMRVLLHALSILELKKNQARLDSTLQHYDPLAIGMNILDLIVDNMGLDGEVNRANVRRQLTPILEDHFLASGNIVLRLSNEAINLYLNALELDIEDAQAAAEAVVQSQMARGKFSEAVQSARNANWHSRRYEEKIARVLRETRRDIDRVSWKDEVPALLDEAKDHIICRLDIEDSIMKTAEERLDVLPEGEDKALNVAEILKLVKSCRARHLTVQNRLMTAREVFLEEQVRQVFAQRTLVNLPNLVTDVLEPLMKMPAARAETLLTECQGYFVGSVPRVALSLCDQIEWQLQPSSGARVSRLDRSLPRRPCVSAYSRSSCRGAGASDTPTASPFPSIASWR